MDTNITKRGLTDQEVYTKVKAHLLKQGRKARNPSGGSCKYRATDGAMCAVGCLIPDDRYTPEMEGNLASYVIKTYGFEDLFSDGIVPYELLSDLQELHDLASVDQWPERLAAVAARYELEDI